MSHILVAFSDSIKKLTNFIINFGFIKGGIGGGEEHLKQKTTLTNQLMIMNACLNYDNG